MSALGERLEITLRAGGLEEPDLHVLAVDGVEALSEPYAFDVTFRPASGESLDAASFLRVEAALALRRPTGEERHVHGECVRIQVVEVAAGAPIYRLRIAPLLLRLSHVVQSRIFQEKSIPDVVQEVLDTNGIDVQDSLSGSYPAREYVTQYRESDLSFVTRLLAEEGIWYRFDQAAGGHTLVLGDAPGALASAAALPLRPGGEQGDGSEHLARLEAAHAVASGKVTARAFDFEQPGVDLTAARGDGDLEVYEYPAGHLDEAEGRRLAQLRLEALRMAGRTFRGAGNALAFAPGVKVDVEDGPALAVVRVRHRAGQERSAGAGEKGTRYSNAFEALDGGLPYRPPRGPARPRLGLQTATVTGPAGEEVHVDRHGRIKVQLHWDRHGKRDEKSSCWVRVAQAWAGAQMGATWIPRVGQEVVVRWLEGDPDRPLVTGAVFNVANPPPLALPDDKTRAVRRTDTSPGSGGFNELTFEDAAGSEEVHAHAQKDWNAVVQADRAEQVQVGATLEVGKDRQATVRGSHRVTVGEEHAAAIGGNAGLTVMGSQSRVVATGEDARVGGPRTVTVGAKRSVTVTAASADNVGGAAALTVDGGYAVSVGGAINHAVGGLKNTAVGGAAVEVVGAAREERIGKTRSSRTQGDFSIQVKGGDTLLVDGDAEEQIDGAVSIEAQEGLAILCNGGRLEADKITVVVAGKTALVLERSGSVKVAADAVTMNADGAVKLKGATVKKVAGAAAASGAANVAALAELDPANQTVKVAFKDRRGSPALAGVKFKLKTPAGERQGGVDGSGVIAVGDLKPGKCELELVGLDED